MIRVCVSLLGILCHSCANVQTRFNVLSLQISLPVIILVFLPLSLSVNLLIRLSLYPFHYLSVFVCESLFY